MLVIKESPQELVQNIEKIVGTRVLPLNKKNTSLIQTAKDHPARYQSFIEFVRWQRNNSYNPLRAIHAAKKLKLLNNLEDYIIEAENGIDNTLIPRQLETFKKIHSFLEQGNTEGHVTLPTGVGKTVIFSKFMQAATRNNPMRGLVVGPTKIILHQNKWKMNEFGEIDAGSYFGTEKNLSHSVTVTTYASLRNGIEKGEIKPETYDFLILDEAHRALGEKTVGAIELFPKEVIKLGFTATPEYHEEKSVADILPVTIDELAVSEAIMANVLSGLKVYFVPTKKDLSKVERKGKEYDEKFLENIINTSERNNLIVRVYKENPEFNGRRSVVYCGGREHGKEMMRVFVKNGIKAAYIDGETDQDTREIIFSQFKHGDLEVLCNAEVLIEGFDEPEAEVCINAAPTLSRVVAEQRGGRVLRRSRKNDNKIGKIIEVVDTFEESENTPVLYSEIAGAAEIIPEIKEKEKSKEREQTGERKVRERKEIEVTTELVDDPKIIMNLTNRNRKQRFTKMFEYAPKGWVHSRQLAKECGIKESEISVFSEKERTNHPEWYKRYLTSTDILLTHYHPNLANTIRRQFNAELNEMMTPLEFAQQSMTEEQASKMLSSAEERVTGKPKRYEGATYYPKREYTKEILAEQKIQLSLENELIEEAEELFWNDDDRTNEERERDYWATFDGTLKDKEDIRHKRAYIKVYYDDNIHQDISREELRTHISEEEKRKIHEVLEEIDKKYPNTKQVLLERAIGKKFGEIGNALQVSGERIRQIEVRGLRLIKGPWITLELKALMGDLESDDKIIYQEKIKEQERLSKISEEELLQNYKILRENALIRKPYGLFGVLTNSMLHSDIDRLDNYENLKSFEKPQVSRFLSKSLVRAILMQSKSNFIGKNLSLDRKMISLYRLEGFDRLLNTGKDLVELEEAYEISKLNCLQRGRVYPYTLPEIRDYARKYTKHFGRV